MFTKHAVDRLVLPEICFVILSLNFLMQRSIVAKSDFQQLVQRTNGEVYCTLVKNKQFLLIRVHSEAIKQINYLEFNPAAVPFNVI